MEFVKTVSLQSNPSERIVIQDLMMLADEMSIVEGDNNALDPQEKSPGPSSSSQFVGSTFEISEDGTQSNLQCRPESADCSQFHGHNLL